ncbi:MAG: IS110 family transposase [Limisphaerales bacterium]
MSPNNQNILYVGLDVAKLSLQLHLAGRFHSLANDAKGHAQLLKLLRRHPDSQVVCEATGGYEQPVVRVLHAAGTPVSIVEAGRVRYFARAQGQRAKTDPIDAAVLSQYGATFQPAATTPATPHQQRLADLCQRRRQLIHTLTVETNRAEHYTDPLCRRQARALHKALDKQIKQCDQAITQLIATDAILAHKAKRLEAIPGVGPVVAATVLAEMPELGQLNRQTAAALAGVAPYNRDSGGQTGTRHISGGRRPVRCALYMATLSAVRYDRILKEFYLRLRAAGKKPLVAITACMRKLVILMNHLLKKPNFSLAT